MGHMVAKDVYGALGDKIDSLTVRTPQTEAFHAMLRELYSPEEAELIVKMPFTLSKVGRIAKLAGKDPAEVEPLLAELERFGFLLRYQAEGRGFIQVLKFLQHQNPHHKEPPSAIPSPQSLGLLPHGTDAKPETSCTSTCSFSSVLSR